MSETYLMPLTVPQRLLILVMMRMAHHDDAAFLTEQLLPQNHDLRPRTFVMSAHNIVATDQVFYQTATSFPTVTAMVQSAVNRALAYGRRHEVIGEALAGQPDLPKPKPDFEVDLAMSYHQRKRLATYCLFSITTRLQASAIAELGRLMPGIVLLDKLLPKAWSFSHQTVPLDEVDLATLAPILLGVSENYAGFDHLLTQMLDGVKAKDTALFGLLNALVRSAHDELS